MTFRPDVTVAALVYEHGRFLLVEERIEDRVRFNQPAGHLEAGETLLEAVVREALEETAWRFEPQFLLGVYQWRHPRSSLATLRFAFGGTVTDFDAQRPLDREIIATHWLTRAEVVTRGPQLRTPLVLRCIDDYLGGRRLPLEALAALEPSPAEEAATP
jgi:8-oxo-dGTP pyrophosphatase MutT (NUDIX family)